MYPRNPTPKQYQNHNDSLDSLNPHGILEETLSLKSSPLHLNLPPKRNSSSSQPISFSSEQMQEIRILYKNLRRDLLDKLDHHQTELLLLLQNITVTSFNPFFESPKNAHPSNKTSYTQKYLSITCIYNSKDTIQYLSSDCPSLIDFEDTSSSSITKTNKLIMYPFGYYKLKDSLSSHHIDFIVRSLNNNIKSSEIFKIQGIFEQSEDGYWIISFDLKDFEEFPEGELKLEFEGVLI